MEHVQKHKHGLPHVREAKSMARELRLQQAGLGQQITQAQALEDVAHGLGFRDWNSCHAAMTSENRPAYEIGQCIGGSYLGQRFHARILAVRDMGQGWYRLALDLDEPVDVVKFDSFSSFRKRVTGTVGAKGHSQECTSDGQPHLILDK